ncbi:MAG TPA: 50S ribosomal protein L31 [Candidatus Moranbacteria bacterium]|nr:50S ribosomal protein L31 [Candidatus Moranbacteria bacterium]
MKKKIHPKYYQEATINCACGNVFNTGATQEKMEVEICSACHPFYTGKKKLVDSAGQVDRFKKIMEKTEALKKEATARKKAKKNKLAPKKKKSSQEITKVAEKKSKTTPEKKTPEKKKKLATKLANKK